MTENTLAAALEREHLTILRLTMDSWTKNDHELWSKHLRDNPDCGVCKLLDKQPDHKTAPV